MELKLGVKEETFAGKIREAARRLGAAGGTFTVQDLGAEAGVQEYADHRRIGQVMRDFLNAGEVERAEPGRYRYLGKGRKKRTKQDIMWDFARIRGTVTLEDLQEVAGVSEDYAREWVGRYVRMGIVVNHGEKYRFIETPLEMPVCHEKAAYLRELRSKRKAALAALGRAAVALDEARVAVNEALVAVAEVGEGEEETK